MSYLTNFRCEDAGALLDTFHGCTCFLVCGGPSLRLQDLDLLNRRGILIAAVNNVAATAVRPHIWFSVDDVSRFSETIWQDPGVMKFTREDRLGMRPSRFEGGQWVGGPELVRECPNVWGFKAEYGWDPQTFLTSRLPTVGTDCEKRDPDGERFNQSVMFPALRILYDLGIRRLYLLGADFSMSEERPYAFDEGASGDKVERNNLLYGWLDRRFSELRPVFNAAKFKIWNASEVTALTAFERVRYVDVVKREGNRVNQNPITRGQYR